MTDVEKMECAGIALSFFKDNDAMNKPLWYDEYNEHTCSKGMVREGASKAVIIADDCDYVVKVPFNGTTQSGDICIHCEMCPKYKEWEEQCAIRREEIQKKVDASGRPWWECAREVPHIDDPCDGCDNCEYEDFHEEFTGAGCFYRFDNDVDFKEDDYCGSEAWLYARACEWGVEEAFLEIEKLGEVCAHPVYVQKRVAFDKTKTCSEDSKKRFKSLHPNQYTIGEVLGGMLIDAYGEDFTEELYRFIKFYGIDDLHNRNWTIVDGKPKIVDYGGYKECN